LPTVALTSNGCAPVATPTNPTSLSTMRNLPGIFIPGHKKALADPKILGRAKKAPHPVLSNNEARHRHGSIHKKAPPVSTSTFSSVPLCLRGKNSTTFKLNPHTHSYDPAETITHEPANQKLFIITTRCAGDTETRRKIRYEIRCVGFEKWSQAPTKKQ
jgi:hypothetical protein